MIETVALLGAKLLPPAPGPFHLDRPRLHEHLAAGLEGRVTVVLAGPGYGKTSLVARYLQARGADSVWYSLDGSDRDPWIFFRYLIQGLREHAPEFGERTEGLWRDFLSRSGEAEHLADIFINDAEESLGGRFILVLDEVHHLERNALCTRALKRLVTYLPGTLHLILIGRSLPELGLKALSAGGAAHLLNAEDLRFTPAETRTLLLETFSLPMKPETADKIHARTRGWVTALQLLRQTARLETEAPDLPEEVFVRTESEIFDYFTEEVFASETPDAREFLLASSLPAVVDPDICAEVLQPLDVRRILAGLLERKLFISPLESRGEYYAYDPLFRDYLRRKLRAEKGIEGRRALDLRFGRAFARRGEFSLALSHWVAAEETKATLDLLGRHGKALLQGGMLDAVREAALFLQGREARSALIDDLLGEACRLSGDYGAAVGHFEKALSAAGKGIGRLPATARASTLQGLAYALLKTGNTARAAEIAEKALAEAVDDDPSLLARILNTLSIIRYRENRHEEALAGWQEALARARQAGEDHLILMIAHNLGLPHAVRGDFRRASECFRILTGPDNARVGPEEGAAYLNLARIETLRGEYSRAASLLGDAGEIAHKLRLRALSADVLEAEGTLLRETGNLEAARERYAEALRLFTELGQLHLADGLAEEEAILASCRGDHEEAERLATRVAERHHASGEKEGMASSLLARGEIRARAGEPSRAAADLVEASNRFHSLGRAYEECMALAWLGLVRYREKKLEPAKESASAALQLAAKFDYRAGILRVADRDPDFRQWLTSLPIAPAYLKATVPAGSPARSASLGTISGDTPDLTMRLLGPTEVFRSLDRPIPARAWRIRRALEVFCFLASSRDRRASKDRIVEALWGDARLTVIDRNFHPTISFLRSALNHGHNVPKNFVLYERGAYLLNPAYRYSIDAEDFEKGIRSARLLASKGDPSGALVAYDAALALYRGPLLEDEYGEWTEAPRSHYESLYLAALVEAGNLHLQAGDRDSGLSYLKKLVDHDPLNEEASVALMLALGGVGNRAGVEREYDRLVRTLMEDLRSDPLPETRRAYEKAMMMDAPPSGARTRTASGRSPRREASPERRGR